MCEHCARDGYHSQCLHAPTPSPTLPPIHPFILHLSVCPCLTASSPFSCLSPRVEAQSLHLFSSHWGGLSGLFEQVWLWPAFLGSAGCTLCGLPAAVHVLLCGYLSLQMDTADLVSAGAAGCLGTPSIKPPQHEPAEDHRLYEFNGFILVFSRCV